MGMYTYVYEGDLQGI